MKLFFGRRIASFCILLACLSLAPAFALAADKEVSVISKPQEFPSDDFAQLKHRADTGVTNAMVELGNCYRQGKGVGTNYTDAVKWYRKAAELGNTHGMIYLGSCFVYGFGVGKNKIEAVKWFRKAADLGDANAMYLLGGCYETGEGILKDEAEAVKWWRKAGELGNAQAMVCLGDCYRNGYGVLTNCNESAKWYRRAADLGDAYGMYNLGVCFNDGEGVPSDTNEAAKWFRMAADLGIDEAKDALWKHEHAVALSNLVISVINAEKGDARAMVALGWFYYNRDDPTNNAEAVKWFRKAADLGDGTAQNVLKAINMSKEEVDNVVMLTKKATMGDSKAMFDLSSCYAYGVGVFLDETEAVRWRQKAASLGNADAMLHLGCCYARGRGVAKDKAQAVRWFRKAADLGNAAAMVQLGTCYAIGEGVPQNEGYAYMWYSLATAKDEFYKQFRDQTRNRMTSEQVAEAQKQATEYFERKGWNTSAGPDGVAAKKAEPFVTGTGFFVTIDGYLLTACHVVAKGGKVKVTVNGKTLGAKVVRTDEANDLALVKVDGTFHPLNVVPSRGVKLGADVFAVGFPNIALQGTATKLTKGSVSALSGIMDDPRAFQISVPVQPGNSGGPLLDASGNVIGVVVSQLDAVKTALLTGSLPQGVNYAVKSAYVQPLLDAIPETSAIPPASKARPFDEAVKAAEAAVCIVLAYEAAP